MNDSEFTALVTLITSMDERLSNDIKGVRDTAEKTHQEVLKINGRLRTAEDKVDCLEQNVKGLSDKNIIKFGEYFASSPRKTLFFLILLIFGLQIIVAILMQTKAIIGFLSLFK